MYVFFLIVYYYFFLFDSSWLVLISEVMNSHALSIASQDGSQGEASTVFFFSFVFNFSYLFVSLWLVHYGGKHADLKLVELLQTFKPTMFNPQTS